MRFGFRTWIQSWMITWRCVWPMRRESSSDLNWGCFLRYRTWLWHRRLRSHVVVWSTCRLIILTGRSMLRAGWGKWILRKITRNLSLGSLRRPFKRPLSKKRSSMSHSPRLWSKLLPTSARYSKVSVRWWNSTNSKSQSRSSPSTTFSAWSGVSAVEFHSFTTHKSNRSSRTHSQTSPSHEHNAYLTIWSTQKPSKVSFHGPPKSHNFHLTSRLSSLICWSRPLTRSSIRLWLS